MLNRTVDTRIPYLNLSRQGFDTALSQSARARSTYTPSPYAQQLPPILVPGHLIPQLVRKIKSTLEIRYHYTYTRAELANCVSLQIPTPVLHVPSMPLVWSSSSPVFGTL